MRLSRSCCRVRELRGKSALVSGSASEIGRATSLAIAERALAQRSATK